MVHNLKVKLLWVHNHPGFSGLKDFLEGGNLSAKTVKVTRKVDELVTVRCILGKDPGE